MYHTPSSKPDEDPPRWQLGAAAQGYPHDEADLEDEREEEPEYELTDTEREYLNNLARPDDEPTEDFSMQEKLDQAYMDGDLEVRLLTGPEYRAMVSRDTDRPDPLVQEPKGKP